MASEFFYHVEDASLEDLADIAPEICDGRQLADGSWLFLALRLVRTVWG
jgi:hypothetical protein